MGRNESQLCATARVVRDCRAGTDIETRDGERVEGGRSLVGFISHPRGETLPCLDKMGPPALDQLSSTFVRTFPNLNNGL